MEGEWTQDWLRKNMSGVNKRSSVELFSFLRVPSFGKNSLTNEKLADWRVSDEV